jgi:serine carboxypeptidase 1
MWLQGGPGAAGSGYGNFLEMGPLDENLQPRNTTWVQAANVLYVDQPVGTGYSYCNDVSQLTTNLSQIVSDLLMFTDGFFTKYPSLTSTPFYGFSESYGGKMMAGYGQGLLAAIGAGTLNVNFKGVAFGDSWICPECYVDTWGQWLRYLSVLDSNQYATQLEPAVSQCDADVAAGNWVDATNDWGNVENIIEATTDGISFYNVLQHNQPDDAVIASIRQRGLSEDALRVLPVGANPQLIANLYARHAGLYGLKDNLDVLMNGVIKQQLKIIPASM